MLKYMLDTNICIYTIKNKPQNVRSIFNELAGSLCVSSVTVMELIYGAEKSAAQAKSMTVVEGFLARLQVLDYDEHAAAHTGQIRAELSARGAPIGPYDAMLAGHCRAVGFVMVTNNVREFDRVGGLRLEDWTLRP